jgi:hypothetical protein
MPPPPSARARFVALVLAGACLLGADFSRPDPASFTLGATTEQEIRQRFGTPYGQATARVGDKVVTTLRYTYVEVRSTALPARAMTYTFHEGQLVGFDYSSSFVVDETAFDESIVKQIKRGESTGAEVLALAGRPASSSTPRPRRPPRASTPMSTATRAASGSRRGRPSRRPTRSWPSCSTTVTWWSRSAW